MSIDLVLKSSCSGCGSTKDLYGSNCKHMTMCLKCGKSMAENHAKCYDCGATVTRLIREYNVRASPSGDKNYFIGTFATGLPSFSKKKYAESKWSLHKEGLHGRQVNDALREKYKNRPWLLEDGTRQFQYQGHMEGLQATYYLLILQGKEFNAIPAGSWYNFKKVAQYKQLTLEEAEEKTKNRKKTADGYQRWMMKAANNGPAAFGGVEMFGEKENGTGGGRGRKKASWDDEEGNVSDRGDEDEEEEAARKNRLGMNKRTGDDDDQEGPREGDTDDDMDNDDDDDIEKGDDWEHEETFTDDDEAIGIDPEEREDWAHEVPAPPEIKEDEEDEDEENGECGLSISGKELKKLLRKTHGVNDSDADKKEDLSPTKKGAVKDEPAHSSPAKPLPSSSSKVTSPSMSAKGKRKLNGDNSKTPNGAPPQKKVKQLKPTVKEENVAAVESSATPNGQPSTSTVTAEEIKAVLLQNGPMTAHDLVAVFKSRLRTPEDKKAFAAITKTISMIQKTGGSSYVVLRNK